MSNLNSKSVNPHTAAQAKYDKEHTVGFYLKLNTKTDEDILQWLQSQPSKQGAIKNLIRRELQAGPNIQ